MRFRPEYILVPAMLLAACGPAEATDPGEPGITGPDKPEISPTGTMTVPTAEVGAGGGTTLLDHEIEFGADMSLITEDNVPLDQVKKLYPDSIRGLERLGLSPSEMSFGRIVLDDGNDGDLEYLIRSGVDGSWVAWVDAGTQDMWKTPEAGVDQSQISWHWTRVSLDVDTDGKQTVSTFGGNYVIGQFDPSMETWNIGTPYLDQNGDQVFVEQVRNGGGAMFSPVELLVGGSSQNGEPFNGSVVTQDGVIVDNNGDPIPTTEVTPKPELTPSSFTCWTENVQDGCLGLKEKDGVGVAEKFITSWATGPSFGPFWKDVLGVNVVPSEDQVRAWLEDNGWHIPLKSPSGIDFPRLGSPLPKNSEGLHASFNSFDVSNNPTVEARGYIDLSRGIRSMFFDKDAWETNAGGVQDEYRRLAALNGDSWLISDSSGGPFSSNLVYGLWINEEGVPIWITGGNMVYEYGLANFPDTVMGSEKADNAAIISSTLEGYIRVMTEMTNAQIYDRENNVVVEFGLAGSNRDVLRVPGYFLSRTGNSWFVEAEEVVGYFDDMTLLALYNFFTAQKFAEFARDHVVA